MEQSNLGIQQGQRSNPSRGWEESRPRRGFDASIVVMWAWLGMVVLGVVLAVVRAAM